MVQMNWNQNFEVTVHFKLRMGLSHLQIKVTVLGELVESEARSFR